jgi:hypothetical protein
MAIATMPLNTWMVVEPLTHNQLKPVSTHTTQEAAETERDRRNTKLGKQRYSACKLLEPVAARVH